MATYTSSLTEQETRQHIMVTAVLPHVTWVVLSMLGGGLACAILAGTLAGRLDLPITSAVLLAGAAVGIAPGLWRLIRGRWRASWPETMLVILAFAIITALGLWLAWPGLLPLGRSVDAVHQYQLVRWIGEQQRLPPVDGATRGLMGEMVAYPTGFAFVVNAAAALARVSTLDALFPTVAILGGLCAALVAQLAASAAGAHGWRMVLPGLASVLLLVAHRAFFLEAYIDHSYYAQMLGLALALCACGWLACEQQLSWLHALELGLVLAALLATYPLWVPVPLALAIFVLVARWILHTRHDDRQTERLRLSGFHFSSFIFRPKYIIQLASLLAPLALVAAIDLPARLATGQTVLEHQGVVAEPTLFNLIPLILAFPAVLLVLATNKRSNQTNTPSLLHLPPDPISVFPLISALLLTMLAVGVLALAAQISLIAPYHSVKMLFLLVPLAAAIVGAACIRLTIVGPLPVRSLALLGAAGVLWWTSARFVLPLEAEQIPNHDLVSAAAWLRENDPKAASRAIIVGAPAGPYGYWLQVGLLGQRRDAADTAVAAFTTTPSTPQGWAIDGQLPTTVIVPDLVEAPPGSIIMARFGRAAILRRTTLDLQAANPLVIRYASRWEDGRLKTALEVVHPLAEPLPSIEVRLLSNGHLVTMFALQPNAERTKTQYLGADLVPKDFSGLGYVNSQDYPMFAAPNTIPVGPYQMMLRLTNGKQVLDERLLATFDRTSDGTIANLSLHSGEFDYLRRDVTNTRFDNLNTRFDDHIILTGWHADHDTSGRITVLLRWQAQTAIHTPLATELRLQDSAGATIVSSQSAPQDGFYPTWRWRAGEDVVERRTLILPPNQAAGIYTIHVAILDPATKTELPTKGETRLGDVVVR